MFCFVQWPVSCTMDPTAAAGGAGDQQALQDIQSYLTSFNKEISDPNQSQEFIIQQQDGTTVSLDNVTGLIQGEQQGQATLTVIQADDGNIFNHHLLFCS